MKHCIIAKYTPQAYERRADAVTCDVHHTIAQCGANKDTKGGDGDNGFE